MMEALGFYLLKSSLVSGIFFLVYYIILRKESFFSLSRFYLLLSILFSYIFPFIKINIYHSSSEPFTVINNLQSTVNQFNFVEEQKVNISTTLGQSAGNDYLWLLPLILISSIFLFRFLKNIIHLLKTIHANEKINQAKFTLILFNQQYTFSFFRYIFISQEVWRSPNGNSIINHELSHLKHKHSLDRLMMEIMLIAFWMNPFIYLYRKALEEVHEFQADSDATQNTSIKDYFELVLQQSSAHNYSPLMSPFSYKLIKKRIKMSNYKSSPIKRLLIIIPITIAILTIGVSGTIITKEFPNSVKKTIIKWPSNKTEAKQFNDVNLDKYSNYKKRSFLIGINSKGALWMTNADFGKITDVKPTLINFIEETVRINEHNDQEKQRVYVSLSRNIKTPEEAANNLLQEVIDSYVEVKNKLATKYYLHAYENCSKDEQQFIDKLVPKEISFADPRNLPLKSKKSTGEFSSPIKPEKLKRISTGYGKRYHPLLKKQKMHNGVDYIAPLNTDIIAIGDGVVRKVINEFVKGKGYGKYVIIDHKNGYSSLYAHLNACKVIEGQKVKSGNTIGLIGSTGQSYGSHLHLEIKKDGEYINPAHVIKYPSKTY